jgi:hypothetical protein
MSQLSTPCLKVSREVLSTNGCGRPFQIRIVSGIGRRRRIKMSKFKHGGIIIETRGGNSNFDVILLISMRNK